MEREPAESGPAGASSNPSVGLALVSLQHALIHAQSALMPLVFVQVVARFHVGVDQVGFLVALGNVLSGGIQLIYGWLTRIASRPAILAGGGFVFGAGMTALAASGSWPTFALANVASRLGGSPQHPVGNALLADLYPAWRRGFAISTHIALGNLGTVAVPLVGGWLIATVGWQPAVLAVGLPGLVVAAAIALFVRDHPGRAAAVADGLSWRAAFGRLVTDRSLRWLLVASSVAAAGRGLGIVTTFVPLELSLVRHLPPATVALLYTLLLAGSVPSPMVAGWLADRIGLRPVVLVTYLAGAFALAAYPLVGADPVALGLVLTAMGLFVFVEGALLQTWLAHLAEPQIRDVAFATYFTVMFVVGSVWAALLSALVGVLGEAVGFPLVFAVMAASFAAAALVTLRLPAGRLGATL